MIQANLAEPQSITRIARVAGVSTRHLQTLFNANPGVAPNGHCRPVRLNRASRMLIETRLPALEIAGLTGFASPASFTRAYRRQHGESPRETRGRARR